MIFFGDKTDAIFDVWSIEHFFNGIILSFFLNKLTNDKKFNFLLLIIVSLFWECFEHYLEEGLLGAKIQHWFSGVECWENRLIGDNLMIILGGLLYNRYSKTAEVAFIFAGIFFCIHLCFSSSMELQRILF